MKVKCLSVKQPDAHWIVTGAKRIIGLEENPPYRGPLLIHSSFSSEELSDTTLEFLRERGESAAEISRLPRSYIIGAVDIVDVIPKVREDGRVRGPSEISDRIAKVLLEHGEELTDEELLDQGYFFCDHWMPTYWIFAKPRQLAQPVRCRGALDPWTPPDSILNEVSELL
ncbi:hypothetical protein AB1L42_22975 [Thalassoglobus sp. JC818]|uniref:hypothetical protein n=1 Tax=Thalassoglobus sp. JC818 TaxID=3232136 RepID=UPI003459AB04